jgi:hypothetical protein
MWIKRNFQLVLCLFTAMSEGLLAESTMNTFNEDSWSLLQVYGMRYGCVDILDYSLQSDEVPSRSTAAELLSSCTDHSSDQIRSTEDVGIVKKLHEELAPELESGDKLSISAGSRDPKLFLPKLKVNGAVAMFSLYGDTTGGEFLNPETGELVSNPNEAGQLVTAAIIEFKTSFFETDVMNLSVGFGNNGKDAATNLGLTFYPNNSDRTGVPTFTTAGTNALTLFPNQPFFFRAGYTFSPVDDLRVTIGPKLYPNDHIDMNSYANNPFLDFSSYLFTNNSFIIPYALNFFGGGGGAFSWNPNKQAVTLRGVYIGKSLDVPSSRGDRSGELIGDPHSASLELEYAKLHPQHGHKLYALRFQFTNSDTYDVAQNAFGLNAEGRIGDWALFGRYGYSFAALDKNAEPLAVARGTLDKDFSFQAEMWTVGTGIVDLAAKNSLLAIAVGRPFDHGLRNSETFGPNTNEQMNYELFWRFGSAISVTPGVSVITDAGNRADQPTIVEGFLRGSALF